jgi:hypothetical protein
LEHNSVNLRQRKEGTNEKCAMANDAKKKMTTHNDYTKAKEFLERNQ